MDQWGSFSDFISMGDMYGAPMGWSFFVLFVN